ncbi:hypothetical protein EDB19DRAFT_1748783, partial [Suillus lakei]
TYKFGGIEPAFGSTKENNRAQPSLALQTNMKFSLTTMIVSAAVMAGVANASNPLGKSCKSPGAVGCGRAANVNGGNAFIYECSSKGKIVLSAACVCQSCCAATTSGVAFCISQKA